MKLSEKAEESPDVDLARQSAPGAYRLETDELTPADELTPEGEFPQFGDFLKVSRLRQGEDELEAAGEQFIECPSGLARWLVSEEIETGEDFRIQSVTKVDGEWQYEAEKLE